MGISGLTALLTTIGAMIAIIGACRIYYLWSSGRQDIEREVMMWVGGILFLTLVMAFHSLIF